MSSDTVMSPGARTIVLRTVCAGHQTITVSGDSMLPTLQTGDRIMVRPGATPRVGDVAVFVDHRGRTVVHRLVARVRGRFVHLGDNRRTFDAPVGDAQLVGVATTVVGDAGEHPIGRTGGRGWLVLGRRCAAAAVRAVAARMGWPDDEVECRDGAVS